MKWAVTGGEGFIGSQFLARLPHAREWKREIECDVIVHLGALAGIQECIDDPLRTFGLNNLSTELILRTAREQSAHVIFASSAAAANPVNPYAASKAAAEAWCMAYRETYRLDVGILRFGNVYGPGSLHKTSCVAQMCKDAIDRGEIVVHGHGAQERDFVYVDDVVDAILERPKSDFSVRTQAYYTVHQVARILSELSGAKIVEGDRRPGDVLKPSDAWTPMRLDYTPLEEGLETTWAYFKSHYSG